MIFASFFTAIIAFLGIYIFYYNSQNKMPQKEKKYTLPLLLSAGFLVRIFAAFLYTGHSSDMACFNSWSDMLRADGFSAFYTSDAFTDYPPGYMYILYLLSFIKDIFGQNTVFTYVALKLPAIISDVLIALCVYKICEKYEKDGLKALLAGFFLFNPAAILNSAVWGQVDSVFTLLVVLMLFMLCNGKTVLSYFIFAVTIFIKPQALFYAPVLLCGIIQNVFIRDFSKKKFLINLAGGVCAILSLFVLALPFGVGNVISQYASTLASYNYASVNAYNLWAALGQNWAQVTPLISIAGYLSITVSVILSIYFFFKKSGENRYFITSAFICFAIFVLSVKMHERYAFPVMALLLCAYAVSSKKEELFLYIGISVLQFLNTFHVLFIYTPEAAFDPPLMTVYVILGWSTVAALALFIIYMFKGKLSTTHLHLLPDKPIPEIEDMREKKVTRRDITIMAVVTLVYSLVALYNLGDLKAPQTFETVDDGSSITLSLNKETVLSKIKLYLGSQNIDETRTLHISAFNENGELTFDTEIENANVFYWESYDFSATAKTIEIYASDTVYIGEIGIFTKDGIHIYAQDAPLKITDEQDTVPFSASYRNSTYFDEIYHARTAYEFIHELPVYEWTHPPLGKTFISLGIRLLGMTPFGWRIAGTLLGIIMIPIIYIFSKKMFGTTWISAMMSIVFAADFMHFSQSRIATIDVYVTFFIMLMYLFMYKYVDDYDNKSFSKTLLPLGLSGFFMGIGIACKWTGVYAGAGLAVVFFTFVLTRHRKKLMPTENLLKTIYFCMFAFVLVPVVIYALSYIPFIRANGEGFYGIIQNQIDMFSYHSDTVVSSTHPFSSPWYQWIINYRPIWYYSGTNGNLSENISAFGNPAVWTAGIIAFIFCVYDAISYRNKNAAFLAIAYLAQLLPWTFVERTTFIYHYFPCVPFLVLMIAHTVHRLYPKNSKIKSYFIGFTVLCVALFILFYPVISGFPVNGDFVRNFLRWLPSWQLIG